MGLAHSCVSIIILVAVYHFLGKDITQLLLYFLHDIIIADIVALWSRNQFAIKILITE